MVPVTVLLPVYNAEPFLRETLESLRAQTFTDFSVLAIDDGSTDKSCDILKEFSETDKRFTFTSRENRGLISTLNEGFELIESKYIARMDADDLCHSQRLELQVKFMEENPGVDVCGTNMKFFGNYSRDYKYPFTDSEIKANILYNSPFCHASVIFRKSTIDRCNFRYDSDFIDCEDYKLWLDMSDEATFANLPVTLYFYRRHGSSVSDLSTKQKPGSQLIRKIALSKLNMPQELAAFHLDYCAERYDHINLELWPAYLCFLKELKGDYLKAGLGHLKIFCQTCLPESHRQQFFDCVQAAVFENELQEAVVK